MEDRYEAFIMADPVFYDVLHARQAESSPFAVAERELPAGWKRTEQDDWLVFYPADAKLPLQGWKIHVSACLDNAEKVLAAVWDYCVSRNIEFKFLRSHAALMARVSKYAPRGYSGKLVTIYPEDDAACETILNELGELLEGEPSPYILSDLRWGKGPLFVRYGSFVNRFMVGDDGQLVGAIADDTGTLVPDRRAPVFYVPPWITLPEFLEPHFAARNAVTMADLPYAIERVLHFSNGGGIYVAKDTRTDEEVVLKEARPHSGLDARRHDAVRRLELEYETLQRFAGIPGIPAARDFFTVGEHSFLAMDFIDGLPLNKAIVRRYPMINLDASAEDFAEFATWALDIYRQVEETVEAIHARGYVYGDLHLFNVMVREDGTVGLLDFEVVAPVADATMPGLGNQGFSAPRGTKGLDVDRYALACLRLAMFLPMTNVLWLSRAKARDFAKIIKEHFPLVPDEYLAKAVDVIAPESVEMVPEQKWAPEGWPQLRENLVRSIVESATPQRDDRLFPGDIRTYSDGGGISLAYGAAGVLYALSATGAGQFPEFEQWLRQRALSPKAGTPPGFYDGLHGAAFALDHLGYQQDALDLLDICLGEKWETLGLDMHSGLAGVGLNLLRFADRTGEPVLRQAGLRAAELVAERLGTEDSVPEISGRANPYAGLMRGSSGAAMLLMRAYDDTGDATYLDRAEVALRQDLRRCIVRPDGALEVNEGWRTMPYLDVGSVGVGVALDEFLKRRHDDRFAEASGQALRAAQSIMYILPGLFSGRAGILAYLAGRADLEATDPLVLRQIHGLSWHALPRAGGIAFPGTALLRMSMDLATGTAGVLLALGCALHDSPVHVPLLDPIQRADTPDPQTPTPTGVGQ
ncbi:serine/threonine protein kinase [Rhizocola hellebori]|uniref:non-specific serine/threonine protein kinase n=1 Tax=Rhizocola hellebori TaxID=1392758 RepID=A0A8J3QF79_9ACTN|nr:class III lanthionine synthetase LanKC [Rhizocola hellebori]GIH08181.1 serine/threonine protein kinase [Rhizocola hellebori]